MKFSTRSSDGCCIDHSENIEQALSYFLAEDGYRLDFHFSDGRVLYIHRAEYGDDIPEEKINHPAWSKYLLATAGVMYYNPSMNIEPAKTDNVISVKFGANTNDTTA